MTNASTTVRTLGRKLGLYSAGLAGLLLLAISTGCNDVIRQEVRQGAYQVISAGLDSFYSELSGEITSGLSSLASSNES